MNWTKEAIHSVIRANYSPPVVPGDEWEQTIQNFVDSYPFDDVTFGSPFNTGNETFGLSQGYKTMAAISKSGFFLNNSYADLSFSWGFNVC